MDSYEHPYPTSIWFDFISFISLEVPHVVSQDSLRPYPWPRSTSQCSSQPEHEVDDDSKSDQVMTAVDMSDSTRASGLLGTSLSSTNSGDSAVVTGCDYLEYQIPPIGVPAGKVLQHAKRVVTALFAKHAPLIFKFGYTHNPRWRWENKLYGYKLDKAHKWSKLLVLYECTEVSGPAMLEAMLIELYGGTLIELKKVVCDIICMYAIYMLCIFFLLHVFFLHYSASPWSAHHFPQVGLDAKTSGLAATVWWCHRSCNPQISTGAAPILYIGLSSTHQRPRQHGLDHVQSDWILGSKVKKISSVLFTLAVETGSNSEKCARMHDSSVMPPDNQSPYAYVKAWNTTHYESTPFPTSETLGIITII